MTRTFPHRRFPSPSIVETRRVARGRVYRERVRPHLKPSLFYTSGVGCYPKHTVYPYKKRPTVLQNSNVRTTVDDRRTRAPTSSVGHASVKIAKRAVYALEWVIPRVGTVERRYPAWGDDDDE